ncbi:hypothetical protein IEQ34_006950 [Dendrobium chrysotoxum]|uniref:Uncharacterized protein n=1 Tax=Dendrobium chrysotoxum TaxID=161865 RepID=A0AAV7H902_DENCH|nr:hypothetical protein IEQ34_006950 [Dendrobium chrysotoxum]
MVPINLVDKIFVNEHLKKKNTPMRKPNLIFPFNIKVHSVWFVKDVYLKYNLREPIFGGLTILFC